jgi:hypothetical protein
MPKINFNILSYVGVFLNLGIFFVAWYVQEGQLQFLAIFNMIMLTIGLLLRYPEKKENQ